MPFWEAGIWIMAECRRICSVLNCSGMHIPKKSLLEPGTRNIVMRVLRFIISLIGYCRKRKIRQLPIHRSCRFLPFLIYHHLADRISLRGKFFLVLRHYIPLHQIRICMQIVCGQLQVPPRRLNLPQ